MIASRRETGRWRCFAAPLAAAALAACATPAPAPVGSPLEPLASVGARVPDEPDLAARDLAAAALGWPRPASVALLERVETLEAERRAAGEPPTGLVPVARDLLNSTLDDPIAYRLASEELLERDDLDPGLRHRLEAAVEDDPLRLADSRLRDERVKDAAQIFNALVGPLTRSVTAGVRGAWGLFRAIVNLAISEHLEDELDFRERQALAHWKRFLELHPDAPEAPEIARRTEDTQLRWHRTRRDRALRAARLALEQESWGAALILAQRAERYAPEDREALEVREKAAAELMRERAQRRRSLQADPDTAALETDPRARALARALLAPDGDIAGAASAILESRPDGPLADEARFALAIAERESPRPEAEDDAWKLLEDVADESFGADNMARHAAATLADPRQNPYGAFRRTRRSDRLAQASWIFFGPLSEGPRDRDLPGFVEWLIDLPGFVEMLTSFPNRLVRFPWMSPWPFGRTPAVHARRYLETHPDGLHAREVASWLEGWEKRRGNWMAAHRVASAVGPRDPGELAELREKAAQQALESATRQGRADVRLAMLRHVVREFQGTEAGAEAGLRARRELEEATFQKIRITRQFLRENPAVAGPDGLGLRPELLDGETANGELHPSGVVLAGGRVLAFQFVAESGRESAEPATRYQRISEERLARLVALLDETATQNYAADPDEVLGPDPERDLFFERARLGVADTPDRRAAARSTYTFLGMRERYGLVRGREPILPFDIVVQGSLPDVSFGVFPRIRTPKPTPDSVLYQ